LKLITKGLKEEFKNVKKKSESKGFTAGVVCDPGPGPVF
jgi:hypothetical protein